MVPPPPWPIPYEPGNADFFRELLVDDAVDLSNKNLVAVDVGR